MTLLLTGVFKSFNCPIKKLTLLDHFFLHILHVYQIGQKAHNTTISRPPVSSILQILTTVNLYSGRPRMGLSVNNKQKIRQAVVKISLCF